MNMNEPTVFWISITLAVVFTLALTSQALQTLVTVHLYKRVVLADVMMTFRYTLKGRNAWSVLLPIVSFIIFGVVLPIRHIDYPKIVLLPVVLFHVVTLALYTTPPSVLLLGSSRWESIRLFNLLDRGIHPYRVVVLLEPSLVERQRHSWFHWISFEFDNLRIIGPHDWREVVHRISERVPLVVLDTRLPSPAVVEETRRILEAPFRDKTLFLLADDGTAPSVAAALPGRSLADLQTTRSTDVIEKLKSMGLRQTTSPDDMPLVAKLSYSLNSKRIARGMTVVAHAGVPFHAALEAAERIHGRTSFVMAAHKLQEHLNGNPGDGALEVFAQLSDDIARVELFLNTWTPISEPEYKNVLTRVVAVRAALCNLQRMVDAAPPGFLRQNDTVLRDARANRQPD
jgi:hypothetical protein